MVTKYVLYTFPYWIYGENKIASRDKLDEWLDQNGIEYDNSFKINEINKDSLTIITKNPNIKYVEVFTDLKTYYYYQTNINFIANKTYQVRFELDWYATYGLDLIRDLNGKNVFVKRSHHALTNIFETALFQDEKLENISPVYSDLIMVEDTDYERTQSINGKNYYYIGSYGYTLDQYHFINLYGVWKAKAVDNRTGYYIYPITNEKSINNTNMSIDGRTTSMNAIKPFNNAITKIRDINTNANWANGFLGIFTGPNFLKITGIPEVTQIDNTSSPSLVSRVFHTSYFQSYKITKPSFEYQGNQKLLLNYKGGVYSPSILNYLDIRMGNSKLDALNFELTSNNRLEPKNGYIGFNESNFTFFNKLTLDDFNETVKTFPGPLISEANPYLEYVAQNKNRINSSLVLGGLSMGGALASGNPLIGAAGLVGGAGSMINQISSLKDAKNRLLNKPNASYDNDNAFYGLSYLLDGIKSSSMLHYRGLKNLAKYNNEIVYYGWKQNKYLPFNITGLNKHFYIQIDANELFNQYPQLFTSIPKNYIELILEMLNNGLRLWNDVGVQYE